MPILNASRSRASADNSAKADGEKEIYCHERDKLKSENSPLRRVLFGLAGAH
jgi:hypothetical protein